MQRVPLPRPATPGLAGAIDRRTLVALLLAAVAIVLTAAILFSELRGAPDSREAGRDRPQGAAGPSSSGGAGTGARPSPPAPRAGNPLEDAGFEAGLGRWRAGQGTRLARVGGGRSGSWAASLAAAGTAGASMKLRGVRRCEPDKQYAVTVWLRASQPGALVRVDLAEESRGRRYAVDTAGAVLAGQGWEPVEVRHVTHQPGAALSIEVAADELPAGGQVLVDDLSLEAATATGPP